MLQTREQVGCIKLLTEIMEGAVEGFNGGDVKDRESAASFFRGEFCDWICWQAGGTSADVIKARLNGSPFDLEIKGRKKPYNGPAEMYEYEGCRRSIKVWSEITGIAEATIRNRAGKWGMCKKVFTVGRIEPNPAKHTFKGMSLTLKEWALKTNRTADGLRWRIKKFGLTDEAFKPVKEVRKKK